MLFDEPTSALDQATETSIISSIRSFLDTPSPGLNTPRTSIFIAHRLSTIKACDKIVVLSQGRVKESGSHEVLLSHDGIYQGMWISQKSKEH